jgi:protein O-GlcNAc transferase
MSTKLAPTDLFQAASTALAKGDLAAAGDWVQKALRQFPKDPNFPHLHGLIAEQGGYLAEAAKAFGKAVALKPDFAEAHFNRGRLLVRLQKSADAIAAFRAALRFHPAFFEAWDNLGHALRAANDWDGAVDAFARAAALRPDRADAAGNLALMRRQICDWSTPLPDPFSLSPAAATVLIEDPAVQRLIAERWAKRAFPPAQYPPVSRPCTDGMPGQDRRVRVGYASCDIHDHATAYLIAELFILHDRARFEVFLYSYGPDDTSPIRQRIVETVEHFVPLHGLQVKAAAERIAADGIDILVDLKGYTKGGHPGLFAHRPAPIQMHWLGYPGTMGADFLPFLLADSVVIPPELDGYYTEEILRLPHSYQINDRQRPIGVTLPRAAYGLPETGFVFACFNQTIKITPQVFAVWLRLLADLPGSVLWLFASNPAAPQRLRAKAAEAGIDPARLIFAENKPLPDHLARYRLADLVLDTFPYGGHTTVSDALWVGTPVVAVQGQSFPSRVAASLLEATGLGPWVAHTLEDYEFKIRQLTQNPAQLAEVRSHLQNTRTTAPLFNTPLFVQDLETVFLSLINRLLRGDGVSVKQDKTPEGPETAYAIRTT